MTSDGIAQGGHQIYRLIFLFLRRCPAARPSRPTTPPPPPLSWDITLIPRNQGLILRYQLDTQGTSRYPSTKA
uniref:Uncharacterized protein n=1 Tax=Oryza nivara TaxID=4536 RepID=A0A0E0GPR8_ORYNI